MKEEAPAPRVEVAPPPRVKREFRVRDLIDVGERRNYSSEVVLPSSAKLLGRNNSGESASTPSSKQREQSKNERVQKAVWRGVFSQFFQKQCGVEFFPSAKKSPRFGHDFSPDTDDSQVAKERAVVAKILENLQASRNNSTEDSSGKRNASDNANDIEKEERSGDSDCMDAPDDAQAPPNPSNSTEDNCGADDLGDRFVASEVEKAAAQKGENFFEKNSAVERQVLLGVVDTQVFLSSFFSTGIFGTKSTMLIVGRGEGGHYERRGNEMQDADSEGE